MTMIAKNFEWEDTKRKLCIFIPNYNRGEFIHQLIDQFHTNCPKEDYLIVVGNDAIHNDMEDLYDKNVRYFQILRKWGGPRNGAFIRNYFIKRCQSINIFQKDPETEISALSGYDWIQEYSVKKNSIVRPMYTLSVQMPPEPVQTVNPGVSHRVHWGFLAPTQMLQIQRGYCEEFTKYGYEDTELYGRLMQCNSGVTLDPKVLAVHHPHEVDTSVFSEVNEMAQVYSSVRRKNLDRCYGNDSDWGQG